MPSKKQPPVITAEMIENARHLLASLPDPAPSSSHSIRKAVNLLVPQISQLRERGYTLAQIADHLNSAGIAVADSTLRNYARQPRQKRSGKNTSGVRKAPAPRRTVAAPIPTAPPQPSPPAAPTKREANGSSSTFVLKPDRAKI